MGGRKNIAGNVRLDSEKSRTVGEIVRWGVEKKGIVVVVVMVAMVGAYMHACVVCGMLLLN